MFSLDNNDLEYMQDWEKSCGIHLRFYDHACNYVDEANSRFHLHDIDGLVQDYSIFSALAMEILQSYTKPSIWYP